MKKIPITFIALLLFLGSTASAALEYKSLSEFPAKEGTAIKTFLRFAEAADALNVDKMKELTTSGFHMMLKNSPTAPEYFNKQFGGIDLKRPFLYNIVPMKDDKILLKMRYYKKNEEKRKNVGIHMGKDGETWKVG